jgi:hypothetical protein
MKTRLALGGSPGHWTFKGLRQQEMAAGRRELQAALTTAAATHLQTLMAGLRAYNKARERELY